MRFKRYKSELDYSYALGMATVVELINGRPGDIVGVYVSPGYRPESSADIFEICSEKSLNCEINQKIFNIAADKENTYVAAVFKKHVSALSPHLPHVVFVNPGDAGNLGTNIRTCLGFDFLDVAIIKPGADIYAPKTVRASMGALFHIRSAYFSSYDEYATAFPEHTKYLFMLNGETELDSISVARGGDGHVSAGCVSAGHVSAGCVSDGHVSDGHVSAGHVSAGHILDRRISLVFGNEATGLPDEFLRYGNSVRIRHSGAIDSLNLSVAAGIAAHKFYNLYGPCNT